MRFVRRVILALCLFVVLAGLLGVLAFRRGVPPEEGQLKIPGLTAEVQIDFDERGIPIVRAENEADLAAAVGFLHARDRPVQLHVSRLAAKGRLAEKLGAGLLGFDLQLRGYDFERVARESMERSSPRSRAWLENYVRGVNAWFASDQRKASLLARVMGPLEPWEPSDPLLIAGLMALRLDGPGDADWWRLDVLRTLGPEALSDLASGARIELDPALLDWLVSNEPEDAGSPMKAALDTSAGDRLGGGSNAFAIGADRTAAGIPILGSDPHLGLNLPGTWYGVVLECPEYQASGMTLPGLPCVVIGRGEHRAFGVTYGQLDVDDLFIEAFDAQTGSVKRGDRWKPLERRTEVFHVRFGHSREVELLRSDLGPFTEPSPGRPAVSHVWTALEPSDPLRLFLELGSSPDWSECAAALEHFAGPCQNLIVAESSGELRHVVIGKLPLRRSGQGLLPTGFATGTWEGWLPEGDRPQRIAGPEGFLVSANDDVLGDQTPVAGRFAHPSRRDQLSRRIAAVRDWTTSGAAELALDVGSPFFDALLAAAGERLGGGELRARLGLASGASRVRGAEAGILREFASALWDELGRAQFAAAGLAQPGERRRDRLLLAILEGSAQADWSGLAGEEDPEGQLRERLERAIARTRAVVAQHRADEIDLRPLWEIESALGSLPGLGPFLGPDLPESELRADGHWSSPLAVWMVGADSEARASGGASMRLIAEPGDSNELLWTMPGGQSEHPRSPHAFDGFAGWLSGELAAPGAGSATASDRKRSIWKLIPGP